MKYPFENIEEKWQKFWDDHKINKTDLSDLEKKLYCLVMFIYPSGAKLHCGHWYNYAPTDSWARGLGARQRQGERRDLAGKRRG